LEELNSKYWNDRYLNLTSSWDIGHISPALKKYFDKLTDKSLKILIPGAGFCHEAEYLHKIGFKNVMIVEFAEASIKSFSERYPTFPKHQIFCENFFNHSGQYDLIIEQTFFCALDPILRKQYVSKMHELLTKKGKLVGLLFRSHFGKQGPPFGGDIEEYKTLFSSKFQIDFLIETKDSIPPRMGNELFFKMSKK